MSTYLDYNASAPIDQRVLDVMIEVYQGTIGNADSRTHNHGESARLVVENAKLQSYWGFHREKFFLQVVLQKVIILLFKD